MARKRKQEDNLLDYYPVHNPKHEWDVEKGIVVIHRENKGIFNTVAQKLFKKPRFSHIKLEEFGSFLWQKMDGETTLGDMALMLKEKFGDKAEPLYPRVVQYMKILKNNNFVILCSEKPDMERLEKMKKK